MNAITFDSHEAALAYQRAGFTEAQVEALVAIDRRTTALPDIANLATKTDLTALKAELTATVESAKYQMLTGSILAMGALTGIAIAVAKLVH